MKDLLIDIKDFKQELEFETRLGRTAETKVRQRLTTRESSEAYASSSRGRAEASSSSSAEYIASGAERHKAVAALLLFMLLIVPAVAAYLYYRHDDRGAINSIAVMPFANVGSDPNAEYLSDGITESIISSLSPLPQLKVMARSTVFRYKGREIDPQKVGRELNVRAVLAGRVEQHGDDLIVSAELVNVDDGAQLWGGQYSRKLSDLLTVKQEIAREIAEKLRVKLTGAEQNQLVKHDTRDPEAYQSYLRGLYLWNKRTAEGLKRAIDEFQREISLATLITR